MTPSGSRDDTSSDRDSCFQASPRRRTAIRLLGGAILAIGSLAGPSATADTLAPLQETGGPGGGSGSATILLSAGDLPASNEDTWHCPPCPTPWHWSTA